MGVLQVERDLDYGTVSVRVRENPTFLWPEDDGFWGDYEGPERLVEKISEKIAISDKDPFYLETYKINTAIHLYCGDKYIEGSEYITPAIYKQGEILHFYAAIDIGDNRIVVDYQPIMIDFQDILISENYQFANAKTLRIAYNPKFSAIKSTIMESKVETLGSQFPFFFRNGNINYKEFNIGGLLSIMSLEDLRKFDRNLADEYEEYYSRPNARSVSADLGQAGLVDEAAKRVYFERKFKRKVEEWLTDGNPKMVRTATEGNFYVRFTNVSLTPMEQLGRQFHSFEATATEVRSLEAIGFNGYYPATSPQPFHSDNRSWSTEAKELDDKEFYPTKRAYWQFKQNMVPKYIKIKDFIFENSNTEAKTIGYNHKEITIPQKEGEDNGKITESIWLNASFVQPPVTLVHLRGYSGIALSVPYQYIKIPQEETTL